MQDYNKLIEEKDTWTNENGALREAIGEIQEKMEAHIQELSEEVLGYVSHISYLHVNEYR